MNDITLKAHAKINLYLDIVGKREDGYHNIKSIIQSVELHDVVHIQRTHGEPAIMLECTDATLPTDRKNIAYRVAEYIMKTYDLPNGLHIRIEKNIPVEAGLGGGSADAAAVLKGMRELFALPLSNVHLAEIGKQFGADVPFCIYGGTMLAEGIGDIFTPLPDFSQTHVLIAKPPFGFSTKEMYSKLNVPHLPNAALCHYEQNKESRFFNIFENVHVPNISVIQNIKAAMIKNGAHASLMSGAGSAVFGLFESEASIQAAVSILTQSFTTATFIITNTISGKD